MLKERNNLALFFKFYLGFILGVFFYLFSSQKTFAFVNIQRCDEELSRYCPGSQYPSTESKIQCVKNKQNLFAKECIAQIFGLPQTDIYDIETNDVSNAGIVDSDIDNNLQNQNILELDLLQQQNDDFLHQEQEQKNKELEQKNKKIKQQDAQITNLTNMVLNRNCITEMRKFCKTRIKRQKLLLKEPLEKCINKMIKHEHYLTINCRSALLNILNNTSDKQYKIYRVANINIVSGQSLRNAKKKLEN